MSSDSHPDLLILPVGGYPPEIGRLIGILSYVREGTLREITRVTHEQLDAPVDRTSHSIGELLGQIALNERLFQARAFDGREPSDKERELWEGELELHGASAERPGRTIEYHLEQLEEIRERTLRHFYRLADPWLDELLELPDGGKANRYWHLFQLAEEEIRHREHIRWLLGRAAD